MALHAAEWVVIPCDLGQPLCDYQIAGNLADLDEIARGQVEAGLRPLCVAGVVGTDGNLETADLCWAEDSAEEARWRETLLEFPVQYFETGIPYVRTKSSRAWPALYHDPAGDFARAIALLATEIEKRLDLGRLPLHVA